mmetsp:Transcript_42487/g.117232  ORF Transcript_42487/g.117232 Transcript_42487/m.117232 type:complete len:335 (-) Transcript_42487:2173-3177(-)
MYHRRYRPWWVADGTMPLRRRPLGIPSTGPPRSAGRGASTCPASPEVWQALWGPCPNLLSPRELRRPERACLDGGRHQRPSRGFAPRVLPDPPRNRFRFRRWAEFQEHRVRENRDPLTPRRGHGHRLRRHQSAPAAHGAPHQPRRPRRCRDWEAEGACPHRVARLFRRRSSCRLGQRAGGKRWRRYAHLLRRRPHCRRFGQDGDGAGWRRYTNLPRHCRRFRRYDHHAGGARSRQRSHPLQRRLCCRRLGQDGGGARRGRYARLPRHYRRWRRYDHQAGRARLHRCARRCRGSAHAPCRVPRRFPPPRHRRRHGCGVRRAYPHPRAHLLCRRRN